MLLVVRKSLFEWMDGAISKAELVGQVFDKDDRTEIVLVIGLTDLLR